jgi:hypothetical protein
MAEAMFGGAIETRTVVVGNSPNLVSWNTARASN